MQDVALNTPAESNKLFWKGITVVIALCLVAAYAQTLFAYANLWWGDSAYTHGFLVAGISIYFVFQLRHKLAQAVGKPFYFMWLPLSGFCLLWLIAAYVDVQIIQMLMFPFILWCGAVAVAGFRVGGILIFPIFYVICAVPIWNLLKPSLQYAAVAATRVNIFLTGLPAEINGIRVEFESGAFAIAEECSGMRFLVAALSLCALYGYVYYDKWRSRILLLLLGAFFALVSNWIRVFGVIIAGYMTDMQHPWVDDHEMFGWVVFACCLVPLFIIAHYLQPVRNDSDTTIEASVTKDPTPLNLSALLITFGIIISTPLTYFTLNYVSNLGQPPQVTLQVPDAVDGWQKPVNAPFGWRPFFDNATDNFSRAYLNGNDAVTLHVFFYSKQQPGTEMIYYSHGLIPLEDKLWSIEPFPSPTISIDPETTFHAKANIIKNSGNTYLVFSWYEVAGIKTTHRAIAKLLQIYGQLTGNQHSALVALSSLCKEPNCTAESEVMSGFTNDIYPGIAQSLEQAVLFSQSEQ